MPIPGSPFTVPVDAAVLAWGFRPDPILARTTPGLEITRDGRIRVDDQGRTWRPGVFAAGDGMTGPDLVVTASVVAMRAAQAMHAYLMSLPPAPAAEAEPAWGAVGV